MAEKIEGENPPNAKPLNTLVIFSFFFYIVLIFGLIIVLPAGDWAWVEGWAYTFSFALLTVIYSLIINKKNPAVIRNRMKTKKTGVTKDIKTEAESDKWLMPIVAIFAFPVWLLPGFSRRYGWIKMPLPLFVEIIGFVLVISGMVLFYTAQYQNAFASKFLDINEGQKLIDTGLYAYVRHPLYSGVMLWFIGTPLALGFWPAVILAIITVLLFVVRIKFEEDMLVKGMEGYEEYRVRVKYKLIPKLL